jgi:hypothetical protein
MSLDSSEIEKKKQIEADNIEFWPIFKECTDTSPKIKFWDLEELKLADEKILIEGILTRLGKFKQLLEEYYYILYQSGIICYRPLKKIKKQRNSEFKGHLKLNLKCFVKLVDLKS